MPLAISYLGYAYGCRGDRTKAKKVLQDAEAKFRQGDFPSQILAEIHAGLGDREKFFDCLSRAYEERSPLLVWLKVYPEYDAMRSDSRYDELLRRMGLLDQAGRQKQGVAPVQG